MSNSTNDLYVEMRETSKNHDYENQTMYQLYQGQLNLSVVQDKKKVCVNVESARHLLQTNSDVYVKIKLSHGNNKRTIHKTQTLRDENPAWNYSCNIKLKSAYSTLLLSVWSVTNNAECLGCMTFDITQRDTCTTTSRTVAEGWHFLLHKSLGTTHHLKVAPHRPGFESSTTPEPPSSTTIRASYSTHHTISLQASADGYGMKLAQQHPVRICKVVNNSVAAKAGILSNDSLIRINDLDVSSLDLSSVVQLIKQSECSLQLTIARQPILDVLQMQQSPRKIATTSTSVRSPDSCSYIKNLDVYSSNSDLLMYEHCRN